VDSSNYFKVTVNVYLIENIPDGPLFMLTYLEPFLRQQLAIINHQIKLQHVRA